MLTILFLVSFELVLIVAPLFRQYLFFIIANKPFNFNSQRQIIDCPTAHILSLSKHIWLCEKISPFPT